MISEAGRKAMRANGRASGRANKGRKLVLSEAARKARKANGLAARGKKHVKHVISDAGREVLRANGRAIGGANKGRKLMISEAGLEAMRANGRANGGANKGRKLVISEAGLEAMIANGRASKGRKLTFSEAGLEARRANGRAHKGIKLEMSEAGREAIRASNRANWKRSSFREKRLKRLAERSGNGPESRCQYKLCTLTPSSIHEWWELPLACFETDKLTQGWGSVCARCFAHFEPEKAKKKLRKEHFCIGEIHIRWNGVLKSTATKVEPKFDKATEDGSNLRPDAMYLVSKLYWKRSTLLRNSFSSLRLFRFQPETFRWFFQIEIDEKWVLFEQPYESLKGRGHPRKTCMQEDNRLAIIAADAGCPGVVLRIAPDNPEALMFKRRKKDELLDTSSYFAPCIQKVGSLIEKVSEDPAEFFKFREHRVFFLDASMDQPVEPWQSHVVSAPTSSSSSSSDTTLQKVGYEAEESNWLVVASEV